MILDSKGHDQVTLGDGRDIFMITTANGDTKIITDFNKDEDRIVLKDVTTSFANLLVNANLLQEGNNVRFTYNSYNLILKNTQISDLDQNNFITSIVGDELDNILNGDEYANAIFGLDGDDILNGNGGDDLLWGGNGSDILNGNAGDDILYYNIDSYWQGSRQVAGKWNIINRTPSTVNADSGDVANLEDHTASQDLFDGGDGDDILIMSEQSDTILLDSALTQVTQFWNQVSYEENNENGFQGTAVDIETIYAFAGDDVINLSSDTNVYGDVRVYGDSGNDTIWTNQGSDTLFGGDGNDDIRSGEGSDIIYGGSNDDLIYAGLGDDTIYGGSGVDKIFAESGDDIIYSGTGNDYVNGGNGNDTYMFNIGDGHDVFEEQSNTNIDTVILGSGIDPDNVQVIYEGSNRKILFKNNSSDSVTLKNNKIENIEFSDSDVRIVIQSNNILWYGDSNDNALSGSSNSDTIIAGAGNDHIEANYGDDVVNGGTGDDRILAGHGNDTYIYNIGDGHDKITDGYNSLTTGAGSGNTDRFDKIKFGEGITKDDLIFTQYNNWNLFINFKNNPTDQLTLYGQLASHQNFTIEYLEFADGSQIDLRNQGLTINGTDGDDTLNGYNHLTSDRDDIISGGLGDDYLKGARGNDTYIFNKGDGKDTILDSAGDSGGHLDINDKLKISGYNSEDLVYRKIGNYDLEITFKNNSDDKILIITQFHQGLNHVIEKIEFDSGEVIDLSSVIILDGTDSSEIIDGIDWTDNVLRAGDGDDTVNGKNHDDSINGGLGSDTLNGGLGSDSFDYSSLEDSSINAMDEIEDFEQGIDKINLSEIEENLSFESFEFTVENGHTIIKDKNSDFAIDLQGQFNLNEDDFIF